MKRRLSIGTLMLLVGVSGWLGCGKEPEPVPKAPEPKVYTVRGVVRQIRPAIDGRTQLSILHEAIPDFVGINGDVVGMKSMTMPFAVADQIDLDDFGPGSRVEFQLSVDWDRVEPGLITAIELLPDDVLLSFESLD